MTRAAALALATLALAACHDGGHADAGLDGGRDAGPPRPDLGRECAYFDGGGVDLGPIPDLGPIMPDDLSVPPPDLGPPTPTTINGCPSLAPCLAAVGDDAGLTYDGFAAPLFAAYCTRCHSTTVTDPVARHNAPSGYNWDDRASVYAHLPEIRAAVGVANYMPFDRPTDLPCARRRQLVLWIDTGAP